MERYVDVAEPHAGVELEPVDARAHGGVRRAGGTIDRAVGVDVPAGADEVEHHGSEPVRRQYERLGALRRVPLFFRAVRAKSRAARGLELEVAMVHRERFLIEHRRTRLRARDAHGPVAKTGDETAKRGLPCAGILRDRHARRRRGVAGEDAAVRRQIDRRDARQRVHRGEERGQLVFADGQRFLGAKERDERAGAGVVERRERSVRDEEPSAVHQVGFVERHLLVVADEHRGHRQLLRLARRDTQAQLPWRARIPANRVDGSLADGRANATAARLAHEPERRLERGAAQQEARRGGS